MRSLTLFTIACSTVASLASTEGQGGSIQALLERVSQRNHQPNAEVGKRAVHNDSENIVIIPPTKPRILGERDAARIERVVDRMAHDKPQKRWIWATSLIQDGDVAPPPGVNTNMLSDGPPVETPNNAQIPTPSFFAQNPYLTMTPDSAATTPDSAATPTTTTTTDSPTMAPPTFAPQQSVPVDVQAYEASRLTPNIVVISSPPTSVPVIAPANRRTKEMPHFEQPSSSTTTTTSTEPTPPAVNNRRTKHLPAQQPTAMAKVRRAADRRTEDESSSTTRRTKSVHTTKSDRRTKTVAASASNKTPVVEARSQSEEEAYSVEDDYLVEDVAGSEEDFFVDDIVVDVLSSAALTSPTSKPTGSASLDELEDDDDLEKRWIWATTLIQDSSPTSGLPPPGQNANLLSSPYIVSTPAATLAPPSFMTQLSKAPTASSSSLTSAAAQNRRTKQVAVASSPTPTALVRIPRSHKIRNELHGHIAKKWLIASSLIQDGDPVPTVGVIVESTPNGPIGIAAPTFMSVNVAAAAAPSSSPAAGAQAAPATTDATAAATTQSQQQQQQQQEKQNWFQSTWTKFTNFWKKLWHGPEPVGPHNAQTPTQQLSMSAAITMKI